MAKKIPILRALLIFLTKNENICSDEIPSWKSFGRYVIRVNAVNYHTPYFRCQVIVVSIFIMFKHFHFNFGDFRLRFSWTWLFTMFTKRRPGSCNFSSRIVDKGLYYKFELFTKCQVRQEFWEYILRGQFILTRNRPMKKISGMPADPIYKEGMYLLRILCKHFHFSFLETKAKTNTSNSPQISQNCQKYQNSWIWWLYLEAPWEMHSNKYKHAWYRFINSLNIC